MKNIILVLLFFLIKSTNASTTKINLNKHSNTDSIIRLYQKSYQDTTKVTLLLEWGQIIQHKYPDSAYSLWTKALNITENFKLKNPKLYYDNVAIQARHGVLFLNIGYLNKLKGNISTAIEYYNKALPKFELLNLPSRIAQTKSNLSVVYLNLGNIPKSLEFSLSALKIREDLKDTSGTVVSLINIGMTFKSVGEIENALQYLNKSLVLSEKINDQRALSISLINIGVILQNKGNYNDALDHYTKSLEILEQTSDINTTAQCLHNIGDVYEQLKNYEKALDYYNKSLVIKEKINDKQGIARTMANIGRIYFRQKKFSLALEHAISSMKKCNEIGFPELTSYTANLLNLIYKETGDYKQALENLEIHIKMRDSLNNIGIQKETIKQQTKYEYEKKEALNKAEFEKKELIAKNELIKQQALIDKNEQTLLLLNKENELKQLTLLQSESNLNQKRIESENQKKTIILLNKEKEIKTTESKRKEEMLKKQNIIIYSISIGVLFVIALLMVAIYAFRQKQKANAIITLQKTEVEEKNKEITDSINYAKRIQTAILPPSKLITELLPQSFVLYKPKDIVAGDFYWLEKKGETILFAACDCTGHGVPGAMVSVICNNGLNRSVREYNLTDPGKILDKTREIVIQEFEKSEEEVKDGMDVSLLAFNGNAVKWSGANNPLWLIRNGEFTEYKANKQPIGKYADPKPFTTHDIALQKGDALYIFTDGLQDQFGGEKGKKFKASKLKELLHSIQNKSMNEQTQIIETAFEQWKGNLEQNDDVCLIGIKI